MSLHKILLHSFARHHKTGKVTEVDEEFSGCKEDLWVEKCSSKRSSRNGASGCQIPSILSLAIPLPATMLLLPIKLSLEARVTAFKPDLSPSRSESSLTT